MKSTKHARRSHFLRNICSDSGVCIAFGIENKKIGLFFNNFTAFDYLVSPIKSIGAVSANGFVKELNYQHQKYTASAILKSSQNPSADNLYYEYFVGQKVNEWTKYFPCFVESYGLYMYTSPTAYEFVKDNATITDMNTFKNSIQLFDQAINHDPAQGYRICTESQYLAVLIQHIKNARTMHSVFGTPQKKPQQLDDCLSALAQIYLPLARLTNDFVHNDLHANNVMLYEPSPGKYIHFFYHLLDGTTVIEFKSNYIAKMIDYGRSFTTNSITLYQVLCAEKKCNPNCGARYGFPWMNPSLTEQTFYTSSTARNPSQDLRLLKSMYPKSNIVFNQGFTNPNKAHYGTEPNMAMGYPNRINNVSDAALDLQTYMQQADVQDYFRTAPQFHKDKKFGDLHVYMDMTKPMKFTLAYASSNYTNV